MSRSQVLGILWLALLHSFAAEVLQLYSQPDASVLLKDIWGHSPQHQEISLYDTSADPKEELSHIGDIYSMSFSTLGGVIAETFWQWTRHTVALGQRHEEFNMDEEIVRFT